MKKYHLILFAALAFGIAFLPSQESRAEQNPVLRIRIPTAIDTGNLTIIPGVYGHGLGISPITTKRGVYDYSVQLGSKAKSVKLLIYAPGYKMVAAEFDVRSISSLKPFVPHFDKLPTTPLKLKIIGSDGKPVVNEKITLSHGLATHRYFGYSDGMAYGAPLLQATSDGKGEVNIQMPLLGEDPYFVKYSLSEIGISNGNGRFFFGGRQDFRPAQIPVRKSYQQPVIITRLYRVKLSGNINQSFLRRWKVSGDITPYLDAKRHSPLRVEMRAETSNGAGYNCMLFKNGDFSVILPAGTYNLHLVILGKGEQLHRKITVKKNVVLRENENRKLIIK